MMMMPVTTRVPATVTMTTNTHPAASPSVDDAEGDTEAKGAGTPSSRTKMTPILTTSQKTTMTSTNTPSTGIRATPTCRAVTVQAANPRGSPDEHHDHGDHHHGGPPAGGWKRHSPFTESTWLMIAPISIIAAGAITLGIVPDYAVFLELATYIVEGVFGESFDELGSLSLAEAMEVSRE